MADTTKDLMDAQEALASGNFDAAVAKYTKVIKADPKCAEAYFGKAEASVGVPKLTPEDVMESYKKAEEMTKMVEAAYALLTAVLVPDEEPGSSSPL